MVEVLSWGKLGFFFNVSVNRPSLLPALRSPGGLLMVISFCSIISIPNAFAKEPTIRVLVSEGNELRIRSEKWYPLFLNGNGFKNEKTKSLNIKQQNGKMQFVVDGKSGRWFSIPKKGELIIKSNNPRGIWLGKRRYRGELKVRYGQNSFKVVNYVKIEKYLNSVVGSEMPKSWPMPALQAQAIAARTYALRQHGKAGFYDVNSTEMSQAYLGVESETSTTKYAVESTKSLVLVYKGKLINAVFHSSSGGLTEASGDVWKQQKPYLISVRDYDDNSPHRKWVARFTPEQLRVAFNELGGVEKINILEASSTGRLLEVRVQGPKGSMLLTGKELRNRLGLKSTNMRFEIVPYDSALLGKFNNSSDAKESSKKNQNKRNLQPSFFLDTQLIALQEQTSPPPLPPILPLAQLPPLPTYKDKNFLIVKGLGSGHGVGMSQWGARRMAENGASFREILTHYYQGVRIMPYKRVRK